jgi:hypothetical protein
MSTKSLGQNGEEEEEEHERCLGVTQLGFIGS